MTCGCRPITGTGRIFALFLCGTNDFRETPPPHAMFMDAVEPLGTWEYVLSGAIYYSIGEERYRVGGGRSARHAPARPGLDAAPGKKIRPCERSG